MRQLPHLAPSALCQLLTASPLHPDPHLGQLASLFVGQPPTWKTNLRKCQRTGKGGRSGGGSKARGNGSVGSRVESFWETGKRQSPTPKSETNGAISRESELLVGEAKDRAPAGDYPPAMGWRGAPISALLGLVGQN